MKKINNYHIFSLILIVFILNTILFRSIDITKAQWKGPTASPSEQLTNIVVNPLQENLDLGGNSIIGEGNINIGGSGYFSGPIGIRTTEPDGYLHIIDGSETGGALFRGSSQYGNTVFYVNSTDDGNSASGEIEARRYDGQRTLISSYRDSYFMGGNVGIGTTEPKVKLDVIGDTEIAGDIRVVNDVTIGGIIKATQNWVNGWGSSHLTHLPWFNLGTAEEGPWSPGYIKLKTPIVHNESNMFSIKIKGYRYGTGGTPVEIRCGGYAYDAGTLISAKCNTEGTSDPVGIGLEDNKVIITIGSGGSTWYYDHFTAEYSGWKSKDPDDFVWEFIAGNDPPPTTNQNNVIINDAAGNINIAGDVTIGGIIKTSQNWVNGWGSSHLTHLPWFNLGTAEEGPWYPGYIKLKTPIVHNESNMFSIKIKGYRYGTGGTPVEIRCGGYAYDAGTLISAKCNTEGTSDPVGIGLEDNKVIITIGSGGSTWYYDHFTAEYSGWQGKNPDDFVWEFVPNSSPPTTNQNNVIIDDAAGNITANNIYSSDLNLSNENKDPNEVDGTRGSWTIQEGAENLFLINRNTGKKYNFILNEIK